MSVFTRLYYANRGPDRYGIDDSYVYPFEEAFHGRTTSPADSYGEPGPDYEDVQAAGPEGRRQDIDPWRAVPRIPT